MIKYYIYVKLLLINSFVEKLTNYNSRILSEPYDSDRDHVWSNGLYTCFLIASSLVLISFNRYFITDRVSVLTASERDFILNLCKRN